MECQLEQRDDSGFRGSQYFSSDILPRKLKARQFKWTGERTFESREDVTILYIRDGEGTAFFNGQPYQIGAGTLLILYPFYDRRIRVNKGKSLSGVECVINMGAVLFMFAIPPYERPVAIFEKSPSFYQLTSDWKERIEGI